MDAAEPDFWHDPQADDDYQQALFGAYSDKDDESDALWEQGDALGARGDTLGFYTALMAISLFLLGVAAVVKRALMRWILIAVAGGVFLVTAVLTATIPFVWI